MAIGFVSIYWFRVIWTGQNKNENEIDGFVFVTPVDKHHSPEVPGHYEFLILSFCCSVT